LYILYTLLAHECRCAKFIGVEPQNLIAFSHSVFIQRIKKLGRFRNFGRSIMRTSKLVFGLSGWLCVPLLQR